MKTQRACIILLCIPALLFAQGNVVSAETPEDIEITKEESIHPFDSTQAFVLGMQSAWHYYNTLLTINPHTGYTTFYEIYTDAQTVIRDFIKTPIALPDIDFRSIEQYYGAILLLLYHEAHQRANDETRHEYERHLEAAVLYRTAYLIGNEYMEDSAHAEDTNTSTVPYLLELLDAQAFNEERYLADLIEPSRNLMNNPNPDEPENPFEDGFGDLPELESLESLNLIPNILLEAPYVTWPPNNESIRSLVREGLILPTCF